MSRSPFGLTFILTACLAAPVQAQSPQSGGASAPDPAAQAAAVHSICAAVLDAHQRAQAAGAALDAAPDAELADACITRDGELRRSRRLTAHARSDHRRALTVARRAYARDDVRYAHRREQLRRTLRRRLTHADQVAEQADTPVLAALASGAQAA